MKVFFISATVLGMLLFVVLDSKLYLIASVIGLLGLCYFVWQRISHNSKSSYLDYKMLVLYISVIIAFLYVIIK